MKSSLSRAGRALSVAAVLHLFLAVPLALAAVELEIYSLSAGATQAESESVEMHAIIGQTSPVGIATSENVELAAGFIAGHEVIKENGQGFSVCPVATATGEVSLVVTGATKPIASFRLDLVFTAPLIHIQTTRGNISDSFEEFGFSLTGNVLTIGGLTFSPTIPADGDVLAIVNFGGEGTGTVTATNFVDDLATLPDCSTTVTGGAQFCPLQNGDVNNDGALSPSDALCAFKCFMQGGTTMPPECLTDAGCEAKRADVNCDNACSVNDCVWIFQRGLCGLPPVHCGDDGTDPCGNFVELAASNEQTELAPDVGVASRFHLEDVTVEPGTTTRLPLAVQGWGTLRAFGLDLEIPEGVEIVAFEKSEATKDWVAAEIAEPNLGQVRLGAFDPDGFEMLDNGWTELGTFLVRSISDEVVEGQFRLANATDEAEGAQLVGGHLLTGLPLPSEFALAPARPNPFSSEVTIRFMIPAGEPQSVEIRVFNIQGQVVRTLESSVKPAGTYEVSWRGDDDSGQRVSSGIYFYRLTAGSYEKTRKLVYTR